MRADLTRRRFLLGTGAGGLFLIAGGIPFVWPRATYAAERDSVDAIARVARIASTSAIASYSWANRGKAPVGYVKGMAVSYAKVYHGLGAGDAYAAEMGKAVKGDGSKDALKHYEEVFQKAGMDNSKDGVDTLRHLFVLMLGLGMRESSGKHCEGRDRSANNTTAETAEAGLFQTSYNARRASPLLPKLFGEFEAKAEPSYLEVFKEGVRCREGNLENYGEGDGREFQRLSKACPFFAVEFAGVGLRNIRRHWGPINRREAEVRVEADEMFKGVEEVVEREKLGALL
jgi:hypothetical protein